MGTLENINTVLQIILAFVSIISVVLNVYLIVKSEREKQQMREQVKKWHEQTSEVKQVLYAKVEKNDDTSVQKAYKTAQKLEKDIEENKYYSK
jgi:uncharacterized membrane protein